MLLWLPRAALVKPERPLPWAPSALLAQLVEHLHGKEGVSGSSPEEGFRNTLQNGRILGISVAQSGTQGNAKGTSGNI